MRVAGVITAFLFIFLLDIPILSKTNHKRKTIWVYSILMLMGFTLSILLAIDKAPTSPSIIIEKIVKTVLGSEQ